MKEWQLTKAKENLNKVFVLYIIYLLDMNLLAGEENGKNGKRKACSESGRTETD